MNLHDIGEDILMEFLQQRYPGYTFTRLGVTTISYRYQRETTEHLLSESNIREYTLRAQSWAAQRHNS